MVFVPLLDEHYLPETKFICYIITDFLMWMNYLTAAELVFYFIS
jgi:hypothetical protein